ncbi:hypothetical protein JW930_00085 [Candidatus Woesearchaeota archaeon]|nr:hypothetical protein [Candidatus Woesearchaeota archaeon]
MQKKAQAFHILEWIISRVPFILVLFVTFYIFFSSQFSMGLESHEVGNLVFTKRFLYSGNALAYRDPETARVYPGIIDFEKFNNETMEEAFSYEKNYIAAKFELENLDTDEIIGIYVNGRWYNRWRHYTQFEQYEGMELRRFVLIKDGDNLYKGALKMDVVVSNIPSYVSEMEEA